MSASARDDLRLRPARGEAGRERVMLSRAFARIDPIAMGVAVGLVTGIGLFLATLWLLVQGGLFVGLHLNRLSNFLPGYEVTWTGSLFGLVGAGVLGFVAGALLALLWNAYHRMFIVLVVARERARDLRRELQEL